MRPNYYRKAQDAAPGPRTGVMGIVCGPYFAKLHLQLFFCPGIHTPCIEYEGKMITPKQFCALSNKENHKDWKGSIRSGTQSIRNMMVSQEIDFHNHAQACSGKCYGRNMLPGEREKEPPKTYKRLPVPIYPKRYHNYGGYPNSHSGGFITNGLPPLYLPPSAFPYQQNPVNMPTQRPMHNPSVDTYRAGELSPTWLAASCLGMNYEPPQGQENGADAQPMSQLDTDPLTFWNEVRRVDLMPDILNSVAYNINNICSSAGDNTSDIGSVASSMTRLVHALNLQQWLVSEVQSRQRTGFTGNQTRNYAIPQEEVPVTAEQVVEENQPNAMPVDSAENDLACFLKEFDPELQMNDYNNYNVDQEELPQFLSSPHNSYNSHNSHDSFHHEINDLFFEKTFTELE